MELKLEFSDKYPGYGFTTCGKVYSFYIKGGRGKLGNTPRLMSTRLRNKYLSVHLSFSDYHKKFSVHRLIYEVFRGEIKPGYHIHHKDGDKLNNNINNLEQLSPKQHNKIDAIEGRKASGERVNTAKLTDKQAKQLYLDKNQGYPMWWLVKKYKISKSQIHKIASGRSRKIEL